MIDNVQDFRDYIRALEEEQRKIQVFQRELPLCLQLVTQTIEAYKQQLSGTTTATTGECFNGGESGKLHHKQQESECSEQTTGDGSPILEEFIPIYDEPNDGDELPSRKFKMTQMIRDHRNDIHEDDKSEIKSDWLRSAQLWNQTTSFPTTTTTTTTTKEERHHHLPKKVLVVEVKKNGRGGAFQPFQKESKASAPATDRGGSSTGKPASTPAASACSTADEAPASGGANNSGSSGGNKDDKDGGQTQRKTRRCWSPELHRRFLNALRQLGGSHVATPKQIRDFMKVDGLTNDEVKSHLQKYRLHTRRPTPEIHHNSTNSTQAQQFVIVGGIWVPPPPDYAAAAAAAALGATTTVSVATSNGRIYTPIATTPQRRPVTTESTAAATNPVQFSHSDDGGRSHSDGGRVRSNSPASSSSTHTTTASPAF